MNEKASQVFGVAASLLMVVSMVAMVSMVVPTTVTAQTTETSVIETLPLSGDWGSIAVDGDVPDVVILQVGVSAPAASYELGSFGRRLTLNVDYRTGELETCSTVAIEDVVLTLTLPQGVSMASETDGSGVFDSATNTVTWELGTLEPGEACFGESIGVTVDVGGSVSDGTMLEATAAITTSTEGDDPADNEDSATFQGGLLPLEVFLADIDMSCRTGGDSESTEDGGGVSCSDTAEPRFDSHITVIQAEGGALVLGTGPPGKLGELEPGGRAVAAPALAMTGDAEGGFTCFELGCEFGADFRGMGSGADVDMDVDVVNPNPFPVPIRVVIDSYGFADCSDDAAEPIPFPGDGVLEGIMPASIDWVVECDPPDDLSDSGEVHLDCSGLAGECNRRVVGRFDSFDDTVSTDLPVVPRNGDRRLRIDLEGDASGGTDAFGLENTIYRTGYGDYNAKARLEIGLPDAGSGGAIGKALQVTAESPVDLLVTDQAGRRVGAGPDREPPDLADLGFPADAEVNVELPRRNLAEIPGGQYTGPDSEPEVVTIGLPEPGEYDLQVMGTGDGPFTITIESLDADGNVLDARTITGEATEELVLDEEIVLRDDGQLGDGPGDDPNQPPVADAGGPYAVDEGGSVRLDGTNSTDPDDDLVFAWDLDGDGTADSSEPMPVFDASDLDGPTTVPVSLTVCDPSEACDTEEVAVAVENVAPTVSAAGDAIDEGRAATVTATFTDPGVLDTHAAEIDWGDGTTEAVAVDQGAGEGSIEATHAYGDDGAYEATVRITDDDGGTGESTAVVVVANLPPALALDPSAAITFPSGEEAVLGTVDQTQSHRAEGTDPGSDDLTFDWTVGGETTYFNDGSEPDPDRSPGGTFPFTAADTADATFDEPGVYEVGVTVTDDDGGSNETSQSKLVTGDADGVRGVGFWRQQYGGRGKVHFSESELEAFLAITEHVSAEFSEETAVDTFDAAHDVLSPSGPEMREKAEAQALAAWLNFAAGGVGWEEQIDTDGDGEADRAFHDVIGEVESILADSGASQADLERAKDLAEAINDESEDIETADGGNDGGKRGSGMNG